MCPPLFPQTSLTFMYIKVSAGHVVSQMLQLQLLTGSFTHTVFFILLYLFKGWVIHMVKTSRCCNELLLFVNRRRTLCHLPSKKPQMVPVAKLWKAKLHENKHLMQCERRRICDFLTARALLLITSNQVWREWRRKWRPAEFSASPPSI